MWTTTIFLRDADIKKVEVLCSDIKKRDQTFDYKIDGKTLSIFSSSKDTAYKRGVIFVKKYLKDWNLGFEVAPLSRTSSNIL